MHEFTLDNVLFFSKTIILKDTQLEPIYRGFKEVLRSFDLSVKMVGLSNEFNIQEFEKTLNFHHKPSHSCAMRTSAGLGVS